MFRLRVEKEMKTASVYVVTRKAVNMSKGSYNTGGNATDPNSSLIEICSAVRALPFGSGVS